MKIQSESREQRAERLASQANDEFCNHVIMSRDNGRWLIKSPSTPYFWTEIIVGHGGYLIAHGDLEHVIWGIFKDPYTDPVDVIRWIGKHSVVDSYTAGKAVIGTGAALTEEVDVKVYAHDLLGMLENDRVEKDERADINDTYDDDGEFAGVIREALEMIARGDDTRSVSKFLYDEDVDAESIARLGNVPAVRVYYAHAAVVRLYRLLTGDSSE